MKKLFRRLSYFSIYRTIIISILIIISQVSAFSQEFITEKVIDTVICKNYPSQSYSLYLPSLYRADTTWQALILYEPAARGSLAVNLFSNAAEKYGFVVVCSNNSKNGPWDIVDQATEAVFDDIFTRFNIDQDSIYAGGFSGGSRAATRLAMNSKKIKAVFACSAGFPPGQKPTNDIEFTYIGFAGNKDFNFLEMFELKQQLDVCGVQNILIEFDGDHKWPPKEAVELAFDWFMNIAQKENYISNITQDNNCKIIAGNNNLHELLQYEKKTQLEILDALNKIKWNFIRQEPLITDKLWWKQSIKDFNDLLEYPKNSNHYNMGSRLLDYSWMMALHDFELYYNTKQYELALEYAKVAKITYPGYFYPHYLMAKALIMIDENRKAIKELETALESKKPHPEWIVSDSVIMKIKMDKKFQKLAEKYNLQIN